MPQGRPSSVAVLDLAAHDEAIGLFEQAAERRAHDQRRHQILEHRARPGDQRSAPRDRGHGAAEPEPVPRRHVALGDRHEAGEPRLGRQQVVAAGVEPVLGHREADRQKPALGVEQEAEFHGAGHGARRLLERCQAAIKPIGIPVGRTGFRRQVFGHRVAPVAFDRALRGLDPEKHVRAAIVAALAGQGARHVGDVGDLCSDVGQACRCSTGPDEIPRQGGIERLQCPAQFVVRDRIGPQIVAQIPQRRPSETHTVPDAGEKLGIFPSRTHPTAAGIGKRDKVPSEIAAVDRRDVGRLERPEVLCVVPVVEMPAEPLQLAHGRHRRFEAFDRFGHADPAKIVSGHCREKVETDIGRRSPMSDDRLRIFLKIVRRKHVVFLRDEGLEETPGAACHQTQKVKIGVGNRQGSGIERRQADPARDGRRDKPRHDEGCRNQRPIPAKMPDQDGGNEPDGNAADHLTVVIDPVRALAELGLRCRHPLQKETSADDQAIERPADGIDHQPGLVGEKRDKQSGLRRRQDKIPAERAEVTAQRDAGTTRQQRCNDRQQSRQRDREQDEARPDQGARQRQQPAGHERHDIGRCRKRAAQIVEHFPETDGGNAGRCRDRTSTAATASRRAPSDAGARRRRRSAPEIPPRLRCPIPGRHARRCLRRDRG